MACVGVAWAVQEHVLDSLDWLAAWAVVLTLGPSFRYIPDVTHHVTRR